MIEVKNLNTGLSYSEFVEGILPDVPTWVIATAPTKDELRTIQNTYRIPWEDLEDALDEDERPRLEIESDSSPPFLKLILRVPATLPEIPYIEQDLPQTTRPTVTFLTENSHLITIQSEPFSTKRIRKPIGSRRKRSEPTILVLLDWLESIVKSFELVVDRIDRDLAKVEEEIFQSIKPSSVQDVFHLSRDATYLDAALKGNVKTFFQLEKASPFKEQPDLLNDLEDLSIDLQQQAELLRIYRDLIESSLDAYSSVISNNQNDLIKVLASISLILMIPTLIASLYGMNINLPFEHDPNAFLYILIVSIVMIIPIWLFLRKVRLI